MALGQGDYKYEVVDGWPSFRKDGSFLWCQTLRSILVDASMPSLAKTPHHCVRQGRKLHHILGLWGVRPFSEPGEPVTRHLHRAGRPGLPDRFFPAHRSPIHEAGELEREWGNRGLSGVTHYRKEYNMPTGVAFGLDGSFYVSDGYGNRCVHKYSKEGEHLMAWGEAGSGPGQFAVVHNIGCDKTGRVLVCDRENDRIQLFDPDGEFIEEWNDLEMPGDVWVTDDNTIYVAEQGGYGHVSVWSPDGKRISRFSGTSAACFRPPTGSVSMTREASMSPRSGAKTGDSGFKSL